MTERLQKLIARSGLCSRRAAEELLAAGRVRVNGEVAALGDRADPACDRIEVDGKPLAAAPELVYLMLNKPRGYVTTLADERGRATAAELVADCDTRVFPVGRLDKDTEGLLLFTDDGMLDVRLLRPERHVEKEYEYRAFGHLDEAALRQLETGVVLAEGQPLSRPARAALLAHTTIGESEAYLPERFREKYLKNSGRPVTVGKLWITEGRKHQVKLMVKAVGAHVFYLKRWAIGPVRLDAALAPGAYRPLTPEELHALGL